MHHMTSKYFAQSARPYPTRVLSQHKRDGSPEERAHDRLIATLASDDSERLLACVEVVRNYFNADSAGLHVVAPATLQGATHLDVGCGLFDSQDDLLERLG